jgi:hypothetical protein
VRKLLARRFVNLMGDQLVVTDAGRRHLQISLITEPMGSPVSSVRVLTTKQPQAVEWKEVASEFEKAVVALRTAEPVESPRELSLSSPSTLEAAAVSGSSMQEEVPFDLSPALALLATDIVQGHELKFEEKLPSAVTERHGLGAGEPDRLTQVPALCERPAEISRPTFAWLIENIPRRMRAHLSVEAEVKISTTAADVAGAPVGQGKTGSFGPDASDIVQALSMQLSAVRGVVLIEPQSPETQWVWRGKSQSSEDLANWRFIITPQRRGSNVLTLRFSCKEVGPSGLFTDSALPDRMLEIFVSTNLLRTLARASAWVATLFVGVALGFYFLPALQSVVRLYHWSSAIYNCGHC